MCQNLAQNIWLKVALFQIVSECAVHRDKLKFRNRCCQNVSECAVELVRLKTPRIVQPFVEYQVSCQNKNQQFNLIGKILYTTIDVYNILRSHFFINPWEKRLLNSSVVCYLFNQKAERESLKSSGFNLLFDRNNWQ